MEEHRKRKIRVAIVDDHQSIIDGYVHRLEDLPEVEIVAFGLNGVDLQAILAAQAVDVLLLDLSIPSSAQDLYPYVDTQPDADVHCDIDGDALANLHIHIDGNALAIPHANLHPHCLDQKR